MIDLDNKDFEEWYSELIQDEDFLELDSTSCFVAWNAAKELYKPKWISVYDRLPDEYDSVLVKYKFEICYYVTEGFICVNGNFCSGLSGEEFDQKITHWMEIPE